MRKFKFRAWDALAEQMFGEGYSPQEFWSMVHPSSCDVEEMQFTGLHDANGKEIYEGDILRIPAKNKFEETTFNCFEVFYHDGDCIGGQNIGFCMNRMHKHGSSAGGHCYKFTPNSIRKHGFIVIGNIYENPELLGE